MDAPFKQASNDAHLSRQASNDADVLPTLVFNLSHSLLRVESCCRTTSRPAEEEEEEVEERLVSPNEQTLSTKMVTIQCCYMTCNIMKEKK